MTQKRSGLHNNSPKSPFARILPRWAAVLAFAAAAAACGIALRNLDIEKDITALLPDGGDDKVAVDLAKSAGLLRKVIVAVGPDEPGSERLHRAADAAADAVSKVDGTASVLWRIDAQGAQRGAAAILSKAPLLYRAPAGNAPDEKAVRAQLTALKERLGSPEAIVLQQYLLADPLGFARRSLEGLEASGRALGAVSEGGHLFDAERRYALILIDVSFDPFDVEKSTRFVEDLDKALDGSLGRAGPGEKALGHIALGGPHFAASSGNAVMHDIGFSFGLALSGVAVVALVLALFLRRLRLLAVSFLPGGLGIAAGIAVLGCAHGRLHAVTLGFAATITGVSVDYAIHLLHRAGHAQRSLGLSSKQAMERALGEVAGSILLGGAATVGSFAIVALSGFTGVREIAILSAVSVATALFGTLYLLPPFHGFLLGGRTAAPAGVVERRLFEALERYAPRGRSRFAVLFVFAAIFGLMVFGALGVRASGDPQDLSYRDPALESRKAFVAERFPGLQDQVVIVSSGATLENALAANDALYDALLSSGIKASEVASLSPVLPSARRQDAAWKASRALLERPDVARAFAETGFAPAYFEKISSAKRPSAIGAADYKETALAPFVDESLEISPGGEAYALTRVRAVGDEKIRALAAVAAGIPGAHLVSQRLDAQKTLTQLQRELAAMILIWFGVSFVLLAAGRRSLAFGARALLPPASGVLAAVAVFGAFGRPLTPVSVAAATLILGFGVDFGIFAQPKERGEFAAAGLGVVVSALATIAGFSALIFAKLGALADMGLSITVGVATAFVTALLVVPALSRTKRST